MPSLLAVCFLFMTGFHGAYSFAGDAVRRGLGLSGVEAGLMVLAYGVGFGLGRLGDGAVERKPRCGRSAVKARLTS